MKEVVPVILCGGSGSRLWPLSRAGYPKQFLALAGEKTLFQQCVERLHELPTQDMSVKQNIIVTNADHRFLVMEQLREIESNDSSILLEPMSRNSAPALTLAALHCIENNHDPVLVVTPSDHVVTDNQLFIQALQQSVEIADNGSIVILATTPDRPETGYGYVKIADSQDENGGYTVCDFVEKPDANKAQQYFTSGQYFWNSGIFVVKASVWLKAIQEFRYDIASAVDNVWLQRQLSDTFVRFDPECFSEIPAESVDFAVLEKCCASSFSLKAVSIEPIWQDLGSWESVWQQSDKDNNNNVIKGDVLARDLEDSLVYATSRLVSVAGLKDVLVIETPDAVMIMDKKHCQDVKSIVEHLRDNDRAEYISHRKVNRPWGWYDDIDKSERFKVKRIQINPGASISLQKHYHRAEHWIVVKGTAEVLCGDKKILLGENESTYIPLGEVHRLTNPGSIPLEIIEVQSGSYLEEDDIIRLEDTYGRS